MSDNNTQAAETAERKPPTLADIVREKTDDGRRIIDFFIDVMEDRVDGADLCHRMDAAKELKRHKSGAAARFIARYSGVPCRHILRRRPRDPNHSDGADATASSMEVPAPFSNNLASVLSAVDGPLMTTLVRAQTAHGDTIVEFLDDVMQNRIDGFRPHHRIAAAKELALHIVRDEAPAPTAPGGEPAPAKAGRPAHPTVIPAQAGTHPAHTEHTSPVIPAKAGTHPTHPTVIPADAGTHPAHPTVIPAKAGTHPAHPTVIPAKAGTHPAHPTVIPAQAGTHPTHPTVIPAKAGTHPAHTEPNPTSVHPELVEGPEHTSPVIPAKTGTHPTHTEPTSPVIPPQSLPRTRYGAGTHPTHTEPTSPVIPPQSLPRTRYGAGTHPTHTEPNPTSVHPELVEGPEHTSPVIPVKTGTHPAHAEHTPVIPAQAGTHPTHTEPTSPVIPPQSLPRTRYGAGTHPRLPSQPRTNNPKLKTLPTRKPRRIRRQEGDAKARLRRNAAPSRSPPW